MLLTVCTDSGESPTLRIIIRLCTILIKFFTCTILYFCLCLFVCHIQYIIHSPLYWLQCPAACDDAIVATLANHAEQQATRHSTFHPLRHISSHHSVHSLNSSASLNRVHIVDACRVARSFQSCRCSRLHCSDIARAWNSARVPGDVGIQAPAEGGAWIELDKSQIHNI